MPPLSERRHGRRTPQKKLTYLEQREYDAIEQAVQDAEATLADARRRAEDPSIASDAAALQARFAELAAAQAEVDRLYARWSELEAKLTG
jgi:ATP-binding cassette subfamily F protein uup